MAKTVSNGVRLTALQAGNSSPVWLVRQGDSLPDRLSESHKNWAGSHGFEANCGNFLLMPGDGGTVAGALFCHGGQSVDDRLSFGKLANALPDGNWHLEGALEEPELAVLAFLCGSYRFNRYKTHKARSISLAAPVGVDPVGVTRIADAVFLARDLINTPANDMGPDAIEEAAKAVAKLGKSRVKVIKGAALERGFPMIHAVGRAASQEPRLMDFSWGPKAAPKLTLVGKGVAFDTGGLDIKPSSGMLLMKKDMGGAANVLALARLIITSKLNVRLRVMIPAVENSISASAFRPGDVLASRSGMTVEIGNTDAEGRLILADALTYALEDSPDLLIDMATLTGAARVALGPDVPPFFTDDDALASELAQASVAVADPLWRMPLWQGYDKKLASKIADMNNVATDGFAGAITAALFLKRFARSAQSWAHFDIFGWSPVEKPHAPVGGEAQAIRAIFHVLSNRYA
ncbi:MAG: leucyl aminopeptidase family protein [Rhizobiaceae bacterium]